MRYKKNGHQRFSAFVFRPSLLDTFAFEIESSFICHQYENWFCYLK